MLLVYWFLSRFRFFKFSFYGIDIIKKIDEMLFISFYLFSFLL